MLRKFLGGLVFGAGFAIASMAVWGIGAAYMVPRLLESAVANLPAAPVFENGDDAKLAESGESSAHTREYSFFKHATGRMTIPPQGGILAMAPTSTPGTADRPNTYQIWLTESGLWQIKTSGDKAEMEKLPRPANANVEDLDRLFREKLGHNPLQSTMTVSADKIQSLKMSADAGDSGVNGKLNITVDGVVFLLPNPY